MEAKELSEINNTVKKLVLDYLSKSGVSLSGFSRAAGVHQNQLWVYLHSGNAKKGLHSTTIEKIGKFLAEKESELSKTFSN
jgi:hypothetical protein